MNGLAKLIAEGKIQVEELAGAKKLIERAELVVKGLKACKKTIMFPLGKTEVDCYSYTDAYGEYQSWATCTIDGIFTCYANWGGNHMVGRCNLNSFSEVFLAFEDDDMAHNLQRFLLEQIRKSEQA